MYLDWPGGPIYLRPDSSPINLNGAFPSLAQVNSVGYLLQQWQANGVELFDPGDGLHTYTVYDNLPGAVPEPSTLLLVFAGGLATLMVRRRRC